MILDNNSQGGNGLSGSKGEGGVWVGGLASIAGSLVIANESKGGPAGPGPGSGVFVSPRAGSRPRGSPPSLPTTPRRPATHVIRVGRDPDRAPGGTGPVRPVPTSGPGSPRYSPKAG